MWETAFYQPLSLFRWFLREKLIPSASCWNNFRSDLRVQHLGTPITPERVEKQLDLPHEAVVVRAGLCGKEDVPAQTVRCCCLFQDAAHLSRILLGCMGILKMSLCIPKEEGLAPPPNSSLFVCFLTSLLPPLLNLPFCTFGEGCLYQEGFVAGANAHGVPVNLFLTFSRRCRRPRAPSPGV
jgi:hypothetical protein